MRDRISSVLGIELYDIYGLTEIYGPGIGINCIHDTGMHYWDDYLYLEIDPSDNTSATMKYGSVYYGNPYYDERAEWWYDGYEWNGKGTIKTITVDASCQNVDYSNLSGLFFDFSGLEAISYAEKLNTSNVQDMSRMFVNCSSLTTLNLSGWDTGEVTDMSSMFDGCVSLTALNISGWDTGELTNTQGMFENCVNLKFIYVGAGWSTTKVTDGVAMFFGCENLPNWDYTTDVSKAYVGDGGYLTSNMKTIYCKMEYDWWTQDGAAIGIYAWDENSQVNAGWPGERMSLADGETNIWKFNLDVAKYKCCSFTRVNGSGDIKDWGAKTQDQVIPTDDDNLFTITNSTATWGDNVCNGEWSEYVVVTLDDNADNSETISDLSGKTVAVHLQGRTLTKDGNWNTLCLPFDVTAAQLAESTNPLNGATIKELDAANTSLNTANGTLTLAFTAATSIEAGKPYIVKWTTPADNISNPVFTGVTIDNSTEAQANMTITSNDGNVKFVGQYSPFDITNENINEILYVASGNKIGYSSKTRTLKCFRAHFWVQPNGTQQAARMINIDFGEGVTGVNEVSEVKEVNDNSCYDLQGRKVTKPAKGLYIVNGKKMVIN